MIYSDYHKQLSLVEKSFIKGKLNMHGIKII